MALVTIITLSYNQSVFAEETLNSIIGQSFKDIELIIVDDASKDNSVDVINSWIRRNNVSCRFIAHEKNQGICSSVNEALSYSTGKYFQAIASDDIMLPHKIEKQVAILEANEHCAFTYSDAYMMNEKGSWVPYGAKFIQTNISLFAAPPGNLYEFLITRKNFIPAPSALVRKSFVDEVGGYDESLTFEDYDMWLRLSKKYDAFFMDEPTCLYRVHEKNMTRDLRKNNIHLLSQFNMLSKHIGVSKELDLALEEKLYIILKQLMYNNYPGLKDVAAGFYKRFNKDLNFRDAWKFPALNRLLYRILNKMRRSR